MFLGRKRESRRREARAEQARLSRRVQVPLAPNEGCHIQKRGYSRWPKKVEVCRRLSGHESESWDTAKAELEPLLAALRRAGCPREADRRACGEVPGRNRWDNPRDEPVGQRWGKVESALR